MHKVARQRAEHLANTTIHEGKKRINLGKTLHDYESTGGSTGGSLRLPPGFGMVTSARFGNEIGWELRLFDAAL